MAVTLQTSRTPSVLIVDDEAEMRTLARIFLERAGFSAVDEAADGFEAVQRFLELQPPPVPTVVLLDNRMPGLTGLEAAERMLLQYPDQVIVLFSAHLDDAVRARAESIGIAACVSKLDAYRLPEIIRTLLPSE